MSVYWSKYAQSHTKKPEKGMLTGPVTILQWSFVRDDQPRDVTCNQIRVLSNTFEPFALLDAVLIPTWHEH